MSAEISCGKCGNVTAKVNNMGNNTYRISCDCSYVVEVPNTSEHEVIQEYLRMARFEKFEKLMYEEHQKVADANKKVSENDSINNPQHYKKGKYEVIEIIKDVVNNNGYNGFKYVCVANVLKYVIRSKHKNGIEDLKKAQVYLGWLIDDFEVKE